MQVAVVGAGRWGRLHAAKLAALPGVHLAAIVDIDLGRGRRLAAEHPRAKVCRELDRLPPIDAATVAVDLPNLAAVAAALLERGVPVLVEKPLALDIASAERLVSLAARRRALLAVGYLERFHPAVRTLEPGRALIARRIGPIGPRVGPLMRDWLVHDVDHALRLLGPDMAPVECRTRADRVWLRLAGPDGREARLLSAAGPRRRRRLWLDDQVADLTPPGDRPDPLAAQLDAFCRAVRGGRDGSLGPLATGRDALAVLRVLAAVQPLRTAA